MAARHTALPLPALDDHSSDSSHAMDNEEKAAFNQVLRPDDSYTADGQYWADLPIGKRVSFVTKTDNAEVKKELSWIASMMATDPLSPVKYYFKNAVLPGAGLGLEGYVLFSIGNLTPLFQASFPGCWKKNKVCDANWVAASGYLEVIGILFGQILVGFLGDW